MTKSECFFGFLNVCGCALSIATFNMVFFVLCALIAIRLCIFNNSIINAVIAKSKKQRKDKNATKNGYFYIDPAKSLDSTSIVIAILKSLLLLFLLCFILYYNNKLKRAAFVHNLLFIRQWLMFHCIFYTLLSILLCYYLFTHPFCKIIFATVTIIIVMEIYQIHIVKRFYNNELEHLSSSSCNIDKQSIIPIYHRGY